jgi:hypothetical protein
VGYGVGQQGNHQLSDIRRLIPRWVMIDIDAVLTEKKKKFRD